VLRRYEAAGYAVSFMSVEDPAASMQCTACGTASPAAAFELADESRLEGASDPDDMVLVVAARCPACGRGGAVSLGFGPEASPADADVVASLRTSPTSDREAHQ
jgi:ferredoxin